MLETYFISKNCGHLLSLKNADKITEKDQRLLSNCCADFIIEAYDWKGITFERKKMAAKALTLLFPSLQYKNSADGTVSTIFSIFYLLNYRFLVTCNVYCLIISQDFLVGNGGSICNRIKYLAMKRKNEMNRSQLNISTAAETTTIDTDDVGPNALTFLKQAIIGQLDSQTIKAKLNASRIYRKCILENEQCDLRTDFPFFLSHPTLVSTLWYLFSYHSISKIRL